MSPPAVLLGERMSGECRQRLALWCRTLLRLLNTRHDPALVARVGELATIIETCVHLQALDLAALARLVWAATRDVVDALDAAAAVDVLEVLATLEDLADTERRMGAAAMLSSLFAEQRLTAVAVGATVRELALRWTVRDLAAHRPCDDLLRFALSFGWSREVILERTEQMMTALGKGGHVHA